jgi:hypothetical protein
MDLGQFFSFLIPYTVGRAPWMGDEPVARLYTEQHKQNKRTQTSMPRVRFEPTTPVFEQAKTVHCLATVIGATLSLGAINKETWSSRLRVGRKADDFLCKGKLLLQTGRSNSRQIWQFF